jgi:peptidyl-prolyl cis-trans isomerase SurA
VDRIIAYVNDEIITLSELNEKTKAFVEARKQNPFLRDQNQSLETIRRTILDNLINDRLASQEISRLKISVSDSDVNETIERIKQENRFTQEALEAMLRKEGKTLEDLRQNIRKDLEQSMLINQEVRRKIVITDEQVEAYYQSHLQEFQGRERWRLHDIFLPFPAESSREQRARLHAGAEQIYRQLLQGADFATMAKRYSRGPAAEEGGDLGFFSKGELDPVLEKAIQALQSGEISPVITTNMGLHLIKITDVETTAATSLAEVQETIRRQLYQEEINSKYKEWLQGLRERSYVKVVY